MNNFISLEAYQKNTNPVLNKENNAVSAPIKTAPLKPDSFESSVNNVNKNSSSNPGQINSNRPILQGELEKAKKTGLIERAADKIKNVSGFGVGSKKIQEMIDNNVPDKDIQNVLHKYRVQRENASQAVGDVVTSAAAIGTFFFTKQKLDILTAKKLKIDEGTAKETLKNLAEDLKEFDKIGFSDFIVKNIDKKAAPIAAGALAAGFIGGFVKKNILSLNRIGSQTL